MFAKAYVDAAAISHLVTTGKAKIVEADEKAQLFPVIMMEMVLEEIRPTLFEIRGKNKRTGDSNTDVYAQQEMQRREEELQKELSSLRVMIMNNSTEVASQLQEIWKKVQDLSIESELVGKMDSIDNAWRALDNAGSFWNSMGTTLRIYLLKKSSDNYYRQWKEIYKLWRAGDKKEAKEKIERPKKRQKFRQMV